jgi:enamine deaminase RidA (YjgF/YER057c/UK114 family)
LCSDGDGRRLFGSPSHPGDKPIQEEQIVTQYHPQPETLGPPLGRYSHIASAVTGTLVAIAGQTGITLTGEVPGDIEGQTRLAFANLGAALDAAGATFTDVIKTTTFLVGRERLDGFMRARTTAFQKHYPAGEYPPNTLLLVSGLVEERFVVEVEALVVLPPALPTG